MNKDSIFTPIKKIEHKQFQDIAEKKHSLILILVSLFTITCLSALPSMLFAADEILPEKTELILATTTSVYDTGLIDTLAPLFKASTGYTLKTLAVGTGRALRMGREKECDVLLVHAPPSEEKFLKEGYGVTRTRIMHNYFVIAGPVNDPANIKNAENAADAYYKIYKGNHSFFSRGDNSGTHKKELIISKIAGVTDEMKKNWSNYKEVGQGMSATLQVASELSGYTLCDIGSFLFLSKKVALKDLFNKGDELLNIYSVITISPATDIKINTKGAIAFRNFLMRKGTQWIIGRKGKKEFGQSLFTPDLLK